MVNLLGTVLEEITARERERKTKQGEFDFLMRQQKKAAREAKQSEQQKSRDAIDLEVLRSILRSDEKRFEADMAKESPLTGAKIESEKAKAKGPI